MIQQFDRPAWMWISGSIDYADGFNPQLRMFGRKSPRDTR